MGFTRTAILLIFCFLGVQAAPAQHVPPVSEIMYGKLGREPVIEMKATPESDIVRVAISDNTFKNYAYTEVSIFGTKPINVYDNGRPAGQFPANKPVKFKYKDSKLYLLCDNEQTVLAGKVEIDCPDGLLGVENLNRAGKQALYHGSFELIKLPEGKFNMVNVLEVEDYLKSVVPNEMPVSFGLEALKAQSVAARNYVLSPRAKTSANYDVVDSVASQVYFGANTERTLSTQAVKETEGVTALHNGELILAQYSSTAGGYTESYAAVFSDPAAKQPVSKPYLIARPDTLDQCPLNNEKAALEFYKSKPDSYDVKSPYFRWEREWGADELKEILKSVTGGQAVKELRAKQRGESGKITELEIITANGSRHTVCKELAIRRLLTKNGSALPSANIVFEHKYDKKARLVSVKGYGGGFGHGVGMSQYGAGFMGTELKIPYEKILQHYYTGVSLGTKPVIINPAVSQAVQNFYTKEKKAVIVAENKTQVSKLIANINGKEYLFELENTPFTPFKKKTTEIDISEYIKKGRNTIIFCYPPDQSGINGVNGKKHLRLHVELTAANEGIAL